MQRSISNYLALKYQCSYACTHVHTYMHTICNFAQLHNNMYYMYKRATIGIVYSAIRITSYININNVIRRVQ